MKCSHQLINRKSVVPQIFHVAWDMQSFASFGLLNIHNSGNHIMSGRLISIMQQKLFNLQLYWNGSITSNWVVIYAKFLCGSWLGSYNYYMFWKIVSMMLMHLYDVNAYFHFIGISWFMHFNETNMACPLAIGGVN